MKRFLATLCTIALILSVPMAAFAAENAQNMPTFLPQQGNAPFGGPQMNDQFRFGSPVAIDFDEMVTKGVISQETCDKINVYMEEHKPSDSPEMNGQPPQMNDQMPWMNGQAPEMNGQPPQMNGQAPEMNGQPHQMNGQAPEMNGQPHQMNGQAPEMNGQPPQMDGEAPWMNGEAPEWSIENPAVTGLLTVLLNEGVITQSEYDALVSAISEEASSLKKSA